MTGQMRLGLALLVVAAGLGALDVTARHASSGTPNLPTPLASATISASPLSTPVVTAAASAPPTSPTAPHHATVGRSAVPRGHAPAAGRTARHAVVRKPHSEVTRHAAPTPRPHSTAKPKPKPKPKPVAHAMPTPKPIVHPKPVARAAPTPTPKPKPSPKPKPKPKPIAVAVAKRTPPPLRSVMQPPKPVRTAVPRALARPVVAAPMTAAVRPALRQRAEIDAMRRYVEAYLKATDPAFFVESSRARPLGADSATVMARGFNPAHTLFSTLVVQRTAGGFRVVSREDAVVGPPPTGLQGRGATAPVTPVPAPPDPAR